MRTDVLDHSAAVQPIETKDASGDDLEQAIADLSESVKKSQEDLETKVGKMIADALKPITAAQLEAEKKANRPFARARAGSAIETVDDGGEEAKEQRILLAKFFKQDWAGLKSQIADMQQKGMSVGSDPDGGFLVETIRSPIIRKRLVDGSAMRRMAHIETIPNGDGWSEPTDDDNVGSGWVGETEARPETSTPEVGMQEWPLHEQYAAPKLTQKLLDLSDYNLGEWIEGKIGDRFSDQEASAFVLGSGIKKPRGLLTYDSTDEADAARAKGKLQYVLSGHATQITADKLKALTWSLRAPFRRNAKWLMNSQTAGAIDQLKDNNGQYIWRTGMGAGAPNTLLGYEVEFDESMPDVAAGTTPIAFGNFDRGYLIVDWSGIRLLRDPFTAKPHVVFYAYKRVGGGLRDSEAIKLLKIGG